MGQEAIAAEIGRERPFEVVGFEIGSQESKPTFHFFEHVSRGIDPGAGNSEVACVACKKIPSLDICTVLLLIKTELKKFVVPNLLGHRSMARLVQMEGGGFTQQDVEASIGQERR